MSNPYAARSVRRSPERREPLPELLGRLRQLGASPEEVRAVRDNWNAFDDDWTPERQQEMRMAGDGRLRAMIRSVRADYPFEPDERREPLEENPDGVAIGVDELPSPVNAAALNWAKVPDLLEWVGDDVSRAAVLLEAERAGRNRATLVRALEKVIG